MPVFLVYFFVLTLLGHGREIVVRHTAVRSFWLPLLTDKLRGILALENIHKGDVLIEAPLRQTFYVNRKTRNPLQHKGVGKEYWKKAPWYTKLALLLLAEKWKGEKSKVRISGPPGSFC